MLRGTQLVGEAVFLGVSVFPEKIITWMVDWVKKSYHPYHWEQALSNLLRAWIEQRGWGWTGSLLSWDMGAPGFPDFKFGLELHHWFSWASRLQTADCLISQLPNHMNQSVIMNLFVCVYIYIYVYTHTDTHTKVLLQWAFSCTHFHRKHFQQITIDNWLWQPTPVFLPGESQGRGSLVGCRLWGRTESDTTEAT